MNVVVMSLFENGTEMSIRNDFVGVCSWSTGKAVMISRDVDFGK